MTADLVTDALTMAGFRRQPPPVLLHHSDRGSQYASQAYQARLTTYGMRASMSRKGNGWDTQSNIRFERRTDLTRAGIGRAAVALTCRASSGVHRALLGPAFVT
jgi:putative transposase